MIGAPAKARLWDGICPAQRSARGESDGRLAGESACPTASRSGIYSSIMWVLVLLVAVQGALAAQEALSGKDLFAAHCAACHGRQGEGGRGVSLTNLTRARDDDALFRVIQKGIPGTEMPAAPVSDGEVRALVVFVRSLERCRGRGAGSAAGNSAGERVYLKSGCVACHTVGVEGGVMESTRLQDRRPAGACRRPAAIVCSWPASQGADACRSHLPG